MKSRQYSAVVFRLSLTSLAIIGATAAAPASAQWANWSQHGYVGANIGRTDADFNNAPATSPATATVQTGEDNHDWGGKLYGGYQFHRNFALEGGVYTLGHFDYGYAAGGGALAGNTRMRGLNLDLVGMVPFTDRLSGLARVGAAWTWARANATSTAPFTANGSRTEHEFGPKFGVGLEYAFSPTLAARVEWERYQRVEDPVRGRGHVNMASVGLVYHFGAPAVVPTRYVAPPPPPPARIVAPPPPAPVIVSPPPPPPPPAPAPAPVQQPRPYRN